MCWNSQSISCMHVETRHTVSGIATFILNVLQLANEWLWFLCGILGTHWVSHSNVLYLLIKLFSAPRSLDIFSHWPPQRIKNISESCQTRQYQFNQLVIQDSSESNSIVFITEVNTAECTKPLTRQVSYVLYCSSLLDLILL